MSAANPLLGETLLIAGETTYKLCFDVNAMCYAEERLKKTTDEIVAIVSEEFAGWEKERLDKGQIPRLNNSLTRTLIWAGLQKHHPKTHLIEAGEIMTIAGIGTSATAVINGFFAAFGTAEDGDKPDPLLPA
jgi:hypothetical protein